MVGVGRCARWAFWVAILSAASCGGEGDSDGSGGTGINAGGTAAGGSGGVATGGTAACGPPPGASDCIDPCSHTWGSLSCIDGGWTCPQGPCSDGASGTSDAPSDASLDD